jgi:hypothetical protein
MGDIEEQIEKLREHVPDDKTNDDIRQLIEETGGDEVANFAFKISVLSTCIFYFIFDMHAALHTLLFNCNIQPLHHIMVSI